MESVMFKRRRKGQWLTAGGFLILSILSALVLTKTTLDLGSFDRTAENAIFSSIANEYDDLLTILINETTIPASIVPSLKDYLVFTESYGIGRSTTINQLLLVGMPTPAGLEVVVVNYYNQPVNDFTLTVNNVTTVVSDIPHGAHQIYVFADASSTYNVTYTADILDNNNEPLVMAEDFFFDRRVFGILELELQARDYIRREVIVR